MNLKPGDIVFYMGYKSKLSGMFAKIMGSKWSHCFTIMQQTDEYTYLIETSDFEFTICYLDRYLLDPAVTMHFFRFPVDDETGKKMVSHTLATYYGEVYGYLQLLSFGLGLLVKKIGKWFGKDWHIKNFIRQGAVCTAGPLSALSVSGLEGWQGVDPESIQTEEFYQRVVADPRAQLIYTKEATEKG